MFVGIDLAHEEDEQQIFDTINSLGVRLTTAELLKTIFLVGRRQLITKNSGEKYLKKMMRVKNIGTEKLQQVG